MLLLLLKKTDSIILDYYHKSSLAISRKSDNSPVTEADKRAEKLFISEMKSQFPDHNFFGEETGGKLDQSKFTWIIDPIDGTKNFTKHIPYFSTLIALVKDSEVLLGISHTPYLKTTMYALKRKGAFLDNKKISVSKTDKISESWINHGGINHFSQGKYIKGLYNLSKDCNRDRGFGDFWMHELVAQGKFEISVEAKTHFWDVACFKVIIEEAGGKVTDLNGNPLTPDSTSILATNRILHNKVVKYFK